jgi:hypothetical protein
VGHLLGRAGSQRDASVLSGENVQAIAPQTHERRRTLPVRPSTGRGISILAGYRVKHDDECAPREANDQANADEHEGSHSHSLQSCKEQLLCSRYAGLIPRHSGPCRTKRRRPQVVGSARGGVGSAVARLLRAETPVGDGLDTPLPLSDTPCHSEGQDDPGRACGVQVPGLTGLWVMWRASMD